MTSITPCMPVCPKLRSLAGDNCPPKQAKLNRARVSYQYYPSHISSKVIHITMSADKKSTYIPKNKVKKICAFTRIEIRTLTKKKYYLLNF